MSITAGKKSVFSRNYKQWIPVTIHRAGWRSDPNNVHISNGYMVGTNGYPIPVIRLVRADGTEKWRGVGGYGGQAGQYEENDRIEARIASLDQISVYYVRYNQVKEIPFNLGELINTRTIGLRNNYVQNLGHVNLENLHHLQNLDLSGSGSVTQLTVSPQAPINFYYLGGTSINQANVDYILQMAVDSGIQNGTIQYPGRPSYEAWDNYDLLASRGWSLSLSPVAGTTEILGYTAAGPNDGSNITASHRIEFTVRNADGTVRHQGSYSTMHPGGGAWTFEEDGWIETTYYHPSILNLTLRGKQLKTLQTAQYINAVTLDFQDNNITTVVLTNNVELESFNISNNPLTSISGIAATNLKYLDLRNTNLIDTGIDSVLADLVTTGVTDGTFHYDIKPTSAATQDYLTLINRGWTLSIAPAMDADVPIAAPLNFEISAETVSISAGNTLEIAVTTIGMTLELPEVSVSTQKAITVQVEMISHDLAVEQVSVRAEAPTVTKITPQTIDYRIEANDVLVTFGGAGTVITQLRPDEDIDVGTWSVAPLYSKISDQTNTTFISSTNDNGSTATIGIANPTSETTGGTLHLTARLSSGQQADFLMEVLVGGTVVGSQTVLTPPTTFTDYQVTFTTPIGPTSDIQLRLTRSGGGNPNQRGAVEVGEAYLQVEQLAPAGVTVPVGTISHQSHVEPLSIVIPIDIEVVLAQEIANQVNQMDPIIFTEDGAIIDDLEVVAYLTELNAPQVSAIQNRTITQGAIPLQVNLQQPQIETTTAVNATAGATVNTFLLNLHTPQITADTPTPASNLQTSNSTSEGWTLAWTKGSGGVELTEAVQYRIKGNTTWLTYGTTTANTMTLLGLNPDTRYEMRVRSTYQGQYLYSTIAEHVTEIVAPSNLAISNIESDRATATWTKGSGGSNNEMVRIKPAGGTWSSAGSTTGNSLEITGLNPDTQYEVYVRRFPVVGYNYQDSNNEIFTTTLTTVGAPTNLQITNNETHEVQRFTWSGVTEAEAYEIEVLRASDSQVVHQTETTGTTIIFQQQLPMNTSLIFRIRSRDINLNTSSWTTLSFTTPTQLVVEVIDPEHTIRITNFTDPNLFNAGVASIEVQRKPAGSGTYSQINYDSINGTETEPWQWQDTTPVGGESYDYRVLIEDGATAQDSVYEILNVATTPTSGLQPATNVQFTNVTSSSFTVTWTKGVGDSQEGFMYKPSAWGDSFYSSIGTTGNSRTTSGDSGASYDVKIRTWNEARTEYVDTAVHTIVLP